MMKCAMYLTVSVYHPIQLRATMHFNTQRGKAQDAHEGGVRGRRREGGGDARPRNGRRRDDAGIRRRHEDGLHQGAYHAFVCAIDY